jgi:hypothetical protein
VFPSYWFTGRGSTFRAVHMTPVFFAAVARYRHSRQCVLLECVNIVACRVVSGQRLGKHIPAATDTHAAIEEFETVFSSGPCQGVTRKATGATESVLYGRL